EKIEPQIDNLEEEKSQLEAEMAQPNNDYQHLLKQQKKLEELNQHLEQIMDRWTQLAEKAEQ
ncbi:ABC transporter C-terminal domain-containing protein, partial [Desulfocurvus sp. DL9XJH121]